MFDKPSNPEQVRLWPGTIPIAHRYTAGLAGERFFRALADRGVFLGTRCRGCGIVYCPAAAFCERCLDALDALDAEVEVGPAGTLVSFTSVRIGLDGEHLAEPVVVGLIRLDGADGCLVHRVAAGAAGPTVGMRLEPVLRPLDERTGSLDDVEHFRPV